MKTTKYILSLVALSVALICNVSKADTFITNNETLLINATGAMGTGCPGGYSGFAKYTNSTGGFFITPPTHTLGGKLSVPADLTPNSVVKALRKSDNFGFCDTNSVNFVATNSNQYSLTVYTKAMPTNAQPINVQIIWHTVP